MWIFQLPSFSRQFWPFLSALNFNMNFRIDPVFQFTDFLFILYNWERFPVSTTQNRKKRFIQTALKHKENIKIPKPRLDVSCKSQLWSGLIQSHKSHWQLKWVFDFWGSVPWGGILGWCSPQWILKLMEIKPAFGLHTACEGKGQRGRKRVEWL